MDRSASSVGLPHLPEDPFGQMLASQSAPPQTRTQPLPEDLFSPHNPSSAQPVLANTHTPTSGKATSPLPGPVASENKHLSTAGVLVDTLLAQSSSRQSPLGYATELGQPSATGPAELPETSVSSASCSQHDKPSPISADMAQPSMASTASHTCGSLKQSSSSQQRVASAPNHLTLAASTDTHNPTLNSNQKAVAELSLRASLVEWLADAVAKKLAAAFQNTPGASILARPVTEQPLAAGWPLDRAALSGVCRTLLTPPPQC